MELVSFDSSINPATLEDGEVVGVAGNYVVHFDRQNGTVYNSGLTLQDWLDGHAESWCMTEDEARRVGVEDYGSYVERIRELNPVLVAGNMAPSL